jgi:hypothetical protein
MSNLFFAITFTPAANQPIAIAGYLGYTVHQNKTSLFAESFVKEAFIHENRKTARNISCHRAGDILIVLRFVQDGTGRQKNGPRQYEQEKVYRL